MFGLLSSSQIYGLQQAHNEHINTAPSIGKSGKSNNNSKYRRSSSSVSESGKESGFFATISSMHGMKSPTNFIEKFLKSELLSGYDALKNYKNFQQTASATSNSYTKLQPVAHENNYQQSSNSSNSEAARPLTGFNCLQGSYRSNCDGEFYEAINVNNQNSNEMTIKCSKNLLVEPPQTQAPATLQNYQKLPDCIHDLPAPSTVGVDGSTSLSSGASSGEFNSDTTTTTNGSTTTLPLLNTPVSNLYKKLSFGSRNSKNFDVIQTQAQPQPPTQTIEVPSDNSSSSISTTTTNSSTSNNNKSIDLQRSSSASSSGECISSGANRERKKSNNNSLDSLSVVSTTNGANLTPERAQRRKLLQMISNYDLQNKLLQRELAKEKRRRVEELACVVKSLLCFESKLKTDMKSVNQRLLEKDNEICRLVRQNRALRKKLLRLQKIEQDRDEGVVEDDVADDTTHRQQETTMDEEVTEISDKELLEDCLVLEALQCINCRKQFYDIDLKEIWTQTSVKDGNRKIDDHTTEHGSSSDDTASSSFYGARRSVRYTSKRTAGTFRDYMRSRSMNIDDPSLEQNSEENTSTISRDDSQTSYEKINIYSRTIERMHGVKGDSERESEQDIMGSNRSGNRTPNKNKVKSEQKNDNVEKNKTELIDDDDGIFSPAQDDDIDEDGNCGTENRSLMIVQRRTTEFSEASPKQVYETSTDDWYASASDPEEIGVDPATSKPYGHGAVNPVLECVNQILLQQSMEESVPERPTTLDIPNSAPQKRQQQFLIQKPQNQLEESGNLPRRSSLSGRRALRNNEDSGNATNGRNGTLTRKRVHFSTKNSMVHVPRNDDVDDDDLAVDIHTEMISSIQQQQVVYNSMDYFPPSPQQNKSNIRASTGVMVETDKLDTLNYESIYSNEYEPIGSEQDSSNLYVDMESTTKATASPNLSTDIKMPTKMPPALPPKPANLLKFKKSLQQLDEMPDEHLQQQEYTASDSTTTAASEPDYCSISEVNMAITSVQTVADVHKAPESEADQESQIPCINDAPVSELDLELVTMNSDDTCNASQKTEEIEEMFADVPKLPNVAAIIAPKNPKYQHIQQSDYLVMSPKIPTGTSNNSNLTLQHSPKFMLNTPSNLTPSKSSGLLSASKESPKTIHNPLNLQLHMPITPTQPIQHQQYKRKHMPNILAEINKRMSLPNSPTTPTKLLTPTKSKSNTSLQKSVEDSVPNLPLQAEFDWYNLDAEYGKAPLNQPDLLKVTCDNMNGCKKLEEIHEDHESIVAAADEYNLDEEFSLASDKPDVLIEEDAPPISPKDATKVQGIAKRAAICEAINFPLICENSPAVVVAPTAKAKKMKRNLANFEKFIEGSGLSTKPLPNRRKIYFSGPFV